MEKSVFCELDHLYLNTEYISSQSVREATTMSHDNDDPNQIQEGRHISLLAMGKDILAKWMSLAQSRVMIVRNPDSQKLSGTINNVSMKRAGSSA